MSWLSKSAKTVLTSDAVSRPCSCNASFLLAASHLASSMLNLNPFEVLSLTYRTNCRNLDLHEGRLRDGKSMTFSAWQPAQCGHRCPNIIKRCQSPQPPRRNKRCFEYRLRQNYRFDELVDGGEACLPVTSESLLSEGRSFVNQPLHPLLMSLPKATSICPNLPPPDSPAINQC